MTSILVIAAHPDDEVLGCGGYIAARSKAGDDVTVAFISDGVTSRAGNTGSREVAARRDAAQKAAKILGVKTLSFGDFPDNQLDAVPLLKVVQYVESIIVKGRPSQVLTHFGGDLNIDHRIVSRAVVTACRPTPDQSVKQLLFFEVASSTEWQIPLIGGVFVPNWFEDISTTINLKLKAIEAYPMEIRDWPHPRSLEAVEYLARWRGATCGVEAAEAFVLGRRIP